MQDISQKKSRFKARILQYLDAEGVTPAEFYRRSGMTRGILSQPNGLTEDNLVRFFDVYPEASPMWVVLGIGSRNQENSISGDGQGDDKSVNNYSKNSITGNNNTNNSLGNCGGEISELIAELKAEWAKFSQNMDSKGKQEEESLQRLIAQLENENDRLSKLIDSKDKQIDMFLALLSEKKC